MAAPQLRPTLMLFGGAAVVAVAIGLGSALTPVAARTEPPAVKPVEAPLFHNWPAVGKPDLAIILSGEQHSYLKFCGCSSPQYGGFERRYNFMATLKNKGWPLVGLDLGDIVLQKSGAVHAQTLMKYKTSMQALQLLGYSGIAVGVQDFNLPLHQGLAEFTLQNDGADPKVMAANLNERMKEYPLDDKRSMISDGIVVGGAVKVGAIAVVGPSVERQIQNKTLTFADNGKILTAALAAFDEKKVELKVLLYQGMPDEAIKAIQTFPDKFHVVLCRSVEEEPPLPKMIGKTMLVNVGWRGRSIGVVGAYRKAGGFELHFQLVRLGEEYETDPANVATHKVVALLETYAADVKAANLLSRYPKSPHPMTVKFPKEKVSFVGSDACKSCHAAEYAIWEKTPHGHAYDTLVKRAIKPSLRQFDGECIVCHTVGFEYEGGFIHEQRTAHLKNVGCENCHGPAGLHVSQPANKTFAAALSPWRKNPGDRLTDLDGNFNPQVLLAIDQMCQKCHDIENDPRWKFEVRWPKVDHTKKLPGGE